MRPIRLGVVFDQQILAGGGYQQALNAALLTLELPSNLAEVIYFTTLRENLETLAKLGINAEIIQMSNLSKVCAYLRKLVLDTRMSSYWKKIQRYGPVEQCLVDHKVDLVLAVSPSSWPLALEEVNYITTIWDLCHLDNPEFPEVRWDRQLETREKKYHLLLPRSVAILVDSETSKENIVRRYGIDGRRIHVMPFQPAHSTRAPEIFQRQSIAVHKKYCLDVPYVFYPAQFWAHKNHIYLLEGLLALETHYGIQVGAIFSGADKGNLKYIRSLVKRMNLENRIRFAGFVDNEEIPDLYQQSIALVMPTYFGPTNLPPLEGFELGIPVLYPNIPGMRDQVGDAALLMDLNNPMCMANHLKNLIDNPELRITLIQAGKDRLNHINQYDRLGILSRIIEDFKSKRITWAQYEG